MGFEWDDEKERRNVARHNLNFDATMAILTGKGVERRSDREGEHRWAFTGEHDGKLWTVIFTRRGDNDRIISARRARKNEERDYYNTFA